MEKKPRKPSTEKYKTGEPTPRPSVSIKKHLTDNGYPDAHKMKSIPSPLTGIKQTSNEVPSIDYRPIPPPELNEPSSLLNPYNWMTRPPYTTTKNDNYYKELTRLMVENQEKLSVLTNDLLTGKITREEYLRATGKIWDNNTDTTGMKKTEYNPTMDNVPPTDMNKAIDIIPHGDGYITKEELKVREDSTANFRLYSEVLSPLEILDRNDEDTPPLRHLSYEQQLNLPTPTFEQMKGGACI